MVCARRIPGMRKAARLALACAAAGVVQGAAVPLAGGVGEISAARNSPWASWRARGWDTERHACDGMHAPEEGGVGSEDRRLAGGVNDMIRTHSGTKSWLTSRCAAPSSQPRNGENPAQSEEVRESKKKVGQGIRKGEMCWFSTAFLSDSLRSTRGAGGESNTMPSHLLPSSVDLRGGCGNSPWSGGSGQWWKRPSLLSRASNVRDSPRYRYE